MNFFHNLRDEQKGRFITLIGVMILSFDTLLVRLINCDEWTLIFWRGFLPGVVLFTVQWVMDPSVIRQHLFRLSPLNLITSILFSASTICFVFSLDHTQVASTLVITNTAPLLTAILGYFFLKEKLQKSTLIAIAIAVGGIWLVFGFKPSASEIEGDSLALVSALSMSVYLVTLRKTKGQYGSIFLIQAAVLTSIISLAAGAHPLSLDTHQNIYIFLLGGIVIPFSFLLIAKGPKYLPAAETSLILLLEVLFGPLLVWLIVGEAPTLNVAIGSAIVLITLATLTILQWRQEMKADLNSDKL
ncbi:TPA: DMT family transporter [Photobacterium damselae]